ncbi:MAG: hypothetical protein ABMB14_08805 [Myxococcota bacterium]
MDEHRILARLARVEALHRGATTPGEREAAAKARERLLVHLDTVRADDPIARFVAEHVASLGVPPEPPMPPDELPDERALLGMLARWEVGDVEWEDICAWAAFLVDRVMLPDDPSADGAAVAEVLLQLATLEHVDLRPTDVPKIRRFLRDHDWGAWFALVADAAAR